MKLTDIPLFLSRMRTDRAVRQELAYKKMLPHSDEVNWPARRACLLGLQFDRCPEDRDLILYLLDQEICARQGSGGCGSSLQAVVFFAAELGDPSILWRIMSAKFANFDTGIVIDREAIYCCGVERTLAVLAASDHPARDRFLPAPAQADVDKWWTHQRSAFPDRWEDETDKIGTCEEIGDFEAGAEYLRKELAEKLATVAPGSTEEQKLLVDARHQWGFLGRADEAARLQAKLDAFLPAAPWDRASALRDALTVYTAASQFPEAASKVEPLRAALAQVDSWRTVGLGRMSAMAMADLAIATPDKAAAARVFSILKEMMAGGLEAPPALKKSWAHCRGGSKARLGTR
ncbi:MAG: hypothetical protein FWD68_06330 [Alphaproteobacteria bacterium]|nr:hypothetical protein [Alphaproteobacteria bacterium]